MDNSSSENKIAAEQMKLTIDDMPPDFRMVCKVIGMAKALELVRVFGGDRLHVPQLKSVLRKVTYAAIRREFNGSNHRELARKYGYSVRWVHMILKQFKSESPPSSKGE